MPDPVFADINYPKVKSYIDKFKTAVYTEHVADMKENDNEEAYDTKPKIEPDTQIRPYENSPGKPPGVTGLNNMGNTCFMNSALQCLFNTQFLVKYFLESPRIVTSPPHQALAFSFQKLIKEVWWGKSYKSIYITDFRNTLGNISPQFKDGRQHDCQEFLAITLDTLHEQLKKWNKRNEKEEMTKNGNSEDAAVNEEEGQGDGKEVVIKQENDVEMPSLNVSPPNKRRKEDDDMKIREKAEEFWNNHLANNNTVITTNFQGLYKSTVVCSSCSFLSVTYEPFTYLSLPIVANKNFRVTFVSLRSSVVVKKVEIKIHLMENVTKLKCLVAKQIFVDGEFDQQRVTDLVVAEIGSNRVYRTLDGNSLIKNLNYNLRNIYVFDLNTNYDDLYPPVSTTVDNGFLSGNFTTSVVSSSTQMIASTYLAEDWETDDAIPPLVSGEALGVSYDVLPDVGIGSPQVTSSTESGIGSSDEKDIAETAEPSPWVQCNICLEEYSEKCIKKHRSCACVLCEECIKNSVDHLQTTQEYEENHRGKTTFLKCPICMRVDDYRTFVNFGLEFTHKGPVNLQYVNVYFRSDPNPDDNNNSTFVSRCFGTPLIVRLPSIISAQELSTFLKQYNPFPDRDCKILSVTNDGKSCNHCMFNGKCPGCEIKKEGEIPLKPNTCFAISLMNLSKEDMSGVEPEDMMQSGASNSWRQDDPVIDIHDCVKAFLEIEKLDEQNPWFCPNCKKNQCATKAISICKFPDYLIVYLKRFIFIDHSSNKLNNKIKFPLTDFNLSPYVSGEFAGNVSFDLYSCVCHFGSSHAGHYTAYGKNPLTRAWHYFNDCRVESSTPSETDYSSAYVLFYQKKGIKTDIPMGDSKSYESSSFTQNSSKPICVIAPSPSFPTCSPGPLAITANGHMESSWVSDSSVTTTEPDSSGCPEPSSSLFPQTSFPKNVISLNEMTELSISSNSALLSRNFARVTQNDRVQDDDEVDEGIGAEEEGLDEEIVDES